MNTRFPTSLLRAQLGLVALLCILVGPGSAKADTVYWDAKALLSDLFPAADKVSYEKIVLTEPELETLRTNLGYRPARASWTIFVATDDDSVVGYALFDEERGQHEPITFAVQLDPSGVIQRVEVVVYREAHGSEVRSSRFREQFVGKDWRDALSPSSDLVAVSGATISSHSLGTGARRCAAVIATFLARGERVVKGA